jgi:hypothetical protein
MKDEIDFYVQQLKQYVGWTIAEIAKTPAKEPVGYFGVILSSPDKQRKVVVWILSDDEGNSHGSFNVYELKQEMPAQKQLTSENLEEIAAEVDKDIA